MNLLNVIKVGAAAVKAFTITNAPLIGIACMCGAAIGTAVIAWHDSRKALKKVEAATQEKGEELTKTEKLKVSAKEIAAVVVSVLLTCGCGIASYKIQSIRLAEATTVINSLLTVNRTLNDELEEVRKQSPEIYNKAVNMVADRRLLPGSCPGYKTEPGWMQQDFFYDPILNFSWTDSVEHVMACIDEFRTRYVEDDGGTIGDFYDILRQNPESEAKDMLAWYPTCADEGDAPKFTLTPHEIEREDGGHYTRYVIHYNPSNFAYPFATSYRPMFDRYDNDPFVKVDENDVLLSEQAGTLDEYME